MKSVAVLVLLSAIAAGTGAIAFEKLQRSSDGCPYYLETGQSFNWYQAWEECLNHNMTLITVDSLYKQEQIDGLIKRTIPTNFSYWLAGHDNAVNLRYAWATTGKVFSFTNWAKDQPNRLKDDHCILVHKDTNQWHDFPCSSKLGFVCEDYQCTAERQHGSKPAKHYNISLMNLFASVNKDLN